MALQSRDLSEVLARFTFAPRNDLIYSGFSAFNSTMLICSPNEGLLQAASLKMNASSCLDYFINYWRKSSS